MSFPGPDPLGRGVVVKPGQGPDPGWPRLRLDESSLDQPEQAIERLHRAWLSRERIIVELAVDAARLKDRERNEEPVYSLDPTFEFARERLHFLVWANNYDATRGEPVWWHARLAQRLGARPHPQAEVEVDGAPVWCDGGPRCDLPFAVLHRESIELSRLGLTRPEADPDQSLAPDQQQAVLHRGGAARILAPAGSGKTRVLTSRLRYLLGCSLEPALITALAYNRRAAQEMQSRLTDGEALRGPCQIRTLHALGYALLRRHRGVRLASASEVRSLLAGLVKPKAQLNTDPLLPYIEALQQARMGLIEPKELEETYEDLAGFARVFERYREALSEHNWVDHDEQIYGAIELLLRDPEARKDAQRSCTHLLVDEFQDLTPAFLLLVRLLSAPAYQVFGVGDDDQVIYGYAGATPRYLVDFARYFPGARSYALEVDYRCRPGLIRAASALLDRNQVRVAKNIRGTDSPLEGGEGGGPLDSGDHGRPELVMAQAQRWTEQAVERLDRWLEKTTPENIAVLARVNAVLMPIQIRLAQKGIACVPCVDTSMLRRTGVRAALAYLRLARNPGATSSADLSEALRRPSRKLRRELMQKASLCKSTFELQRFAARQDPWPKSQLEELISDLNLLQTRLARRGIVDFFRTLREDTGFLGALEQLDSSSLWASTSSHRDDLLALEQTAAYYPGPPAGEFEDWLTTALTADQDPPVGANALRLSSVHRVKGLEWDYVLIYGLDKRLFPHHLSDDVEEERRIFHVALTRARQECVLITDPDNLSPFIGELTAPTPAPPKKKKKKAKK